MFYLSTFQALNLSLLLKHLRWRAGQNDAASRRLWDDGLSLSCHPSQSVTCILPLGSKHCRCFSGYFLGARPASLAHKISYWRTDIPTFGPLGAPGAHRFAFRWALMQILHSLKYKVFVMMAQTLIQRADLFPRSRDHFVRNATRLPRRAMRLPRRSEFPCYVGDIQPQTAYPTIPQYRSEAPGGNFRLPLIIRTPCIALTYMLHVAQPFYLFPLVYKFRRFQISLTR